MFPLFGLYLKIILHDVFEHIFYFQPEGFHGLQSGIQGGKLAIWVMSFETE